MHLYASGGEDGRCLRSWWQRIDAVRGDVPRERWVRRAFSFSASASLRRHAASIRDAYFSGAMPVAWRIASASSISDDAAPNAPA